MKKFYSKPCLWGFLVAILFSSGCATQERPSHGPKIDYHWYSLDPNGSPLDNFYFEWSYTAADNTVYQHIEYYKTGPAVPPKEPKEWHWPRTGKRKALHVAKAGDCEEFGWYTSITHPPDGLAPACTTEQGVTIRITHPPDILSPK